MKAFAVFAAVLAAASASPQIIYNSGLGLGYSGLGYSGLTYAAAPVAVAPAVTKTQYHAQDELGQASFGHSEPGQAHAAVRDAAGGVRGSFSYVAPDGRLLTTNYIADHNGYRVASNALPVAPATVVVGPVDTPEVVAAKAQHFAAVAEAQARSGRKKRGLAAINFAAPTVYSSNIVHSAVPALTYAAAPGVVAPSITTYGAHPALTYAAAPAYTTYAAAHPAALTYAAAHPAALTYAAAPAVVAANPLREATLTKVVNTPGHAVSYRVD